MPSSTHSSPTHDYPVLVIDDNMMICRLLVEVLSIEGYTASKALITFDRTAEAADSALHALRQSAHPTIILADPTTFGIPGTESLTAFLQDEAQRHPHLLYLMTALAGADAARAITWLHADGRIAFPFAMSAVLAALAEGEHILRDRASTAPDPFTLDY